MNPDLHIRHCQDFANRVTHLGGEVPADLQLLLDAAEAVLQWQPSEDAYALQNAIRERQFTAETADSYLTAELNRSDRSAEQVTAAAMTGITRAFNHSMHKESADAVIDSLRPAFVKAREGFNKASEWITPSTTAEQVLAAGTDAAAAWSALAEHRRTLDNLYSVAASLYHEFQLVQRQPYMETGTEPVAAFFVGETVDLRAADRAMEPLRGNSLRGGRWTGLRAITQLEWNTLTEARRIIDAQQEGYADMQQRRYAATHS